MSQLMIEQIIYLKNELQKTKKELLLAKKYLDAYKNTLIEIGEICNQVEEYELIIKICVRCKNDFAGQSGQRYCSENCAINDTCGF